MTTIQHRCSNSSLESDSANGRISIARRRSGSTARLLAARVLVGSRASVWLAFVVAMVCSFAGSTPASEGGEDRPNIVFIMADDLGYGELGCYGQSKIKTPHLDQLAKQGMRLLQHYSGAPVCAPSRCVLMTGRHLGRAEIRGNRRSGNGRVFPGQWPLTSEAITIAEVLRRAGYATGAFGKWGLGPSGSTGSPIRQGFDRFFGYNCQRNAHSYYPLFLDSDESEVQINAYPVPGHDRKDEGQVVADDYRAERYAPDLILAKAVEFIREHRDEPFFAYLPFVEPHVAMQPPATWVERYPEAWDQPGPPFDGHGAYRGQSGYLPHPRPRAGYAAMISDLDEHVGAVMHLLDQLGLAEKTLVVFTSDNGPTHRGRDPRFHVGGAACKFFDSTGGLRGYKGSCYEGGIRVPCLVRWPGRIRPDSTSDVVSSFADWFATLAAVAGTPQDADIDGVNLMPALRNQQPLPDRVLIWDFAGYGGIAAVRKGRWKGVRRGLGRPHPHDWELYDLQKDPAETKDVAADHPEVVAAMEDTFRRKRVAEPDFPNPVYDQ